MVDEDSDEDEALRAIAKHFGKELSELSVEALINLEKMRPEEEEEGAPQQKGPSLDFILGTMSSSAALGVSESFSSCLKKNEANGESICSTNHSLSLSQVKLFTFRPTK